MLIQTTQPMLNHILIILLILSCSICNAQKATQTPFQLMLTSYYDEFLKLHPTVASFQGNYQYNDQLENTISLPYREQATKFYSRYLDTLKHYNTSKLSTRDKLSYDIFKYELQNSLQALTFKTYLTPVSQMFDFRMSFSQMGSGASRSRRRRP
jgi:uncharacterized protein (DUF885 family)